MKLRKIVLGLMAVVAAVALGGCHFGLGHGHGHNGYYGGGYGHHGGHHHYDYHGPGANCHYCFR